MKVKERKRKERPIMIFLGNESRKSRSSYHKVKMARDSEMALTEEKKPYASKIAKTMGESCPNNKGTPVLPSLPPGTIKVAENNTMAIRVERSILEYAVSFTQFSPFSTSSLRSTNIFQYAFP
ncbi:hypothetical protein NL676_033512 [Syzygium grande]|nr:hypothetical protein NL676_033512 [Syzygium grande]